MDFQIPPRHDSVRQGDAANAVVAVEMKPMQPSQTVVVPSVILHSELGHTLSVRIDEDEVDEKKRTDDHYNDRYDDRYDDADDADDCVTPVGMPYHEPFVLVSGLGLSALWQRMQPICLMKSLCLLSL